MKNEFQPEEPKVQMTIYVYESQAAFINENFKDNRQKSRFIRFLVGEHMEGLKEKKNESNI